MDTQAHNDSQNMQEEHISASDDQKNDIAQIKDELAEVKEEVRKNLEGWQRAQADFENYKKRKESENKELIEFAKEVTVTKLLPTLDSLEQALKQMPEVQSEDMKKWKSGTDGIVTQLQKALKEMGVEKIEALGQKFDPNKHEAVQEAEGDNPGTITQEYQTGYILNGKVIRPSQVVISK